MGKCEGKNYRIVLNTQFCIILTIFFNSDQKFHILASTAFQNGTIIFVKKFCFQNLEPEFILIYFVNFVNV